MDRRTVIKGAMAGVAVALLPTLPVEEVKYVKTVTIGNMADEDYIQFGPNDIHKFTLRHMKEKKKRAGVSLFLLYDT